MNRALERISPKPMVDGLLKSFGEFGMGAMKKVRTITRQQGPLVFLLGVMHW